VSQSPQAGQFNSYFVDYDQDRTYINGMLSQSPQAGQFNSYIAEKERGVYPDTEMSQSPQAGQFNSYKSIFF